MEKSNNLSIKQLYCGICDYITYDKSNYKKHLLTRKHINDTNDTQKSTNDTHVINPIIKPKKNKNVIINGILKYDCVCGATYSHCQNLYRHRKYCESYISSVKQSDCLYKNVINSNDTPTDTNDTTTGINDTTTGINDTRFEQNTHTDNYKINKKIKINYNTELNNKNILDTTNSTYDTYYTINNTINEQTTESINKSLQELYKENKELKELICKMIDVNNKQNEILYQKQHELLEKLPNIILENSKINSVNSINYTTNINLFLNEKCKDAINMDDFLSNINITVNDLIYTKNKGITEGVSNIFIENMNKLSVYERPLHCTDIKREILYIKNDNKWEKDDYSKSKMKDAIKQIAFMQSKNVKKWNEIHPNYMDNDNLKEDFIYLVKNVMTNITDKENKIIHSICKSLHINYKMLMND